MMPHPTASVRLTQTQLAAAISAYLIEHGLVPEGYETATLTFDITRKGYNGIGDTVVNLEKLTA